MDFFLNGRTFSVDRETVRARVTAVPADAIRTHWVEIDGRRWPVKQAFRVGTGLIDEYFISHRAVRFFQRLGFRTSEIPVTASSSGGLVPEGIEEAPSVVEVPAEETRASTVHREETAAMEITRAERQIEDRLREVLSADKRLAIQPRGQAARLYTDVWDPDKQELFEVKSSSSRQSIRMAVGQLLDYRRYIDGVKPRCIVVVPEDPGADLCDFVLGLGMDLMYWDDAQSLVRITANQAQL